MNCSIARYLPTLLILTLTLPLGLPATALASGASPLKRNVSEFLSRSPDQKKKGGGMVGNGGGTVVCKNADQSIKSVELLDYFEARNLRGMQIDVSTFEGDWQAKAQAVINRLGKLSELRKRVYSSWVSTFMDDALHLQDVQFSQIPDSAYIGVPNGCEFIQAAVQQDPRFPGDYRYILNEDVWSKMDDSQKAGLVIHELVYREALSYGHTDSVATRFLVGKISSLEMKDLDQRSFWDLLSTAHFEQTDVPFLHADGFMLYDSSVIWRAPSQRFREEIKPMMFEGRFIANLGKCLDEGCKQWLSLYHTVEDRGDRYICRGLEVIGAKNQPSAYGGIFFSRTLTPPDAQDCAGKTLVTQETGYTRIDFQSGKDLMNYSKLTEQTPTIDSYGMTHLEYSYRDSSATATTVNAIVKGIDFITHPSQSFILHSSEACQGSPLFLQGATNDTVRTVSSAWNGDIGSKCVMTGTAEIEVPLHPELHYGVYIKMDPSNPNANIRFSEDGSLINSDSIVELRQGLRNFRADWTCSSGPLGCYQYLLNPDQTIKTIVVSGEAALKIIPFGVDTRVCSIENGEYEVYGATLVPKKLRLKANCDFSDAPGSTKTYPAGSVVFFNESGQAEL